MFTEPEAKVVITAIVRILELRDVPDLGTQYDGNEPLLKFATNMLREFDAQGVYVRKFIEWGVLPDNQDLLIRIMQLFIGENITPLRNEMIARWPAAAELNGDIRTDVFHSANAYLTGVYYGLVQWIMGKDGQ